MTLAVMFANKSVSRLASCWAILFVSLTLWLYPGTVRAEETFPTLQVGARTYSNVVVTTKNPRYIMIMHAQGLTSIKLKELPPEILAELGYKMETASSKGQKTFLSKKIELDPRIKELQEKTVEQFKERVQHLDSKIIIGFFAGLFFIYLFWCYCSMLICKKAGYEPGALVWVPIFQFISLLKAAGMSAWCFLLWLIPIANVGVTIVWCVKICQARGKTAWLALPLVLPVTSFFTFLYLAFADGLEEKDSASQKISFN